MYMPSHQDFSPEFLALTSYEKREKAAKHLHEKLGHLMNWLESGTADYVEDRDPCTAYNEILLCFGCDTLKKATLAHRYYVEVMEDHTIYGFPCDEDCHMKKMLAALSEGMITGHWRGAFENAQIPIYRLQKKLEKYFTEEGKEDA